MKVLQAKVKLPILFVIMLVMLLAGCSVTSTEAAMTPQSETTTRKQVVAESSNPTLQDADQDQSTSSSTSSSQQESDGESTVKAQVVTAGELQVHFIDVGQGASQLLIGPTGKTMLIDAGDNSMEGTVVGYLQQMGVKKIDILIGTHPDADHVGGLDKVIDHFDIGNIYMPRIQANTKTYESVLQSIKAKGLKVSTAKAGLTLDWEPDMEVKMIAPVHTYEDTNEMSAVLHLTYRDTSFLLMGDAEAESEADILQSGVDLKADVLLVGHHGSRTSTSEALLNRVKPAYAVIQVGKDNKYDHPAPETLKRLTHKGIQIYRNDEQGNIIVTSDGAKINVAVDPSTYTAASRSANANQSEAATPVVVPIKPTPTEQKTETTSGKLSVKASVDQTAPEQNSTVTAKVQVKDGNGKPVSGAKVMLNLHYKSKDTLYDGITNEDGKASISFKIGRAALGYTVLGDISVSSGDQTSTAQISFTPQ